MAQTENKQVTGRPVEDFPVVFSWNSAWEKLFDKQIEIVRMDLARARFEDSLIVYLSCPISSRGGGFWETNVDINECTARSLTQKWGDRVWVLNPTQYQMESKSGKGLIEQHAEKLGINLSKLPLPSGGDYMRMWTKVLVEATDTPELGSAFDLYYFLGPKDVWTFFDPSNTSRVADAVETFLARKISIDPDYRHYFEAPFKNKKGQTLKGEEEKHQWIQCRNEFIRYYTIRASANYSKGCHDEWNIWRLLNNARRKQGGIGEDLPGYFDGQQIDLGSHVGQIDMGYGTLD